MYLTNALVNGVGNKKFHARNRYPAERTVW